MVVMSRCICLSKATPVFSARLFYRVQPFAVFLISGVAAKWYKVGIWYGQESGRRD